MNYEVLKDFKKVSDVPQSLIEEYEGKITQDILSLWKEYGFGSFFNDYFRVVNPHEYEEIVRDSYFDGANAIPVMVTAFGDMIIHDGTIGKLVNLLYRYRDLEVLGSHFFTDLGSQAYLADNIKNKQYSKALEKYGPLAFDECFGYQPLLGLGGKESIKNLQKIKIQTYIELITQMVGKME